MARNVTSFAAIVAVGLLMLTGVHVASQRARQAEPPSSRAGAYAREAMPVGSDRCALAHARFGGRRAQLIRVTNGGVRNYVVVEVGKRDPGMRSLRRGWLKANYGDAEHVWLGEYGSAEAAMALAASLCPPDRRCWPGEADCGTQAESPTAAQMFFGRWPPATAPAM
jgi:hypothetical protein